MIIIIIIIMLQTYLLITKSSVDTRFWHFKHSISLPVGRWLSLVASVPGCDVTVCSRRQARHCVCLQGLDKGRRMLSLYALQHTGQVEVACESEGVSEREGEGCKIREKSKGDGTWREREIKVLCEWVCVWACA